MSLRLDRLATLYVANPVQRWVGRNQPSIPILMYHSISDEDETKLHPYYRTATSPSVFAQHTQYLHDSGYSAVDVPEAVRLLQNGSLTSKPVVITFDDGYRDFYTQAFPALNRYGFTATVFLPTSFIGKAPIQFKGKDCLTWNEVRELRKHGITFGSHTVTHPQLSTLEPGAVKDEVVSSKRTIEDNLGEAVDCFAYPFAFPEANAAFKADLRDTLRQAGYHNGVCTTIGRPDSAEDVFFLKRLPINSCDDPMLFEAKLSGSYDWLAKPQYLMKMAKKWAGSISRP